MKLTKNDFNIILQEGEGQRIEFKESFSQSLAREIVAFCNSSLGGKILLGVDDGGHVKGLEVSNSLKSKITDLARNCDPPITVELQTLNKCLIINVEEGANKPYQCKEGFFLRQGPNSQKLTRDEIIDFISGLEKVPFDTQINRDFIYPGDFDRKKFKQYLEAIHVSPGYKTQDVLINLGVAQKKRGKLSLNNAGVLFFAKEPCKFFKSAYVDAAVFKGTERVHVINRNLLKKRPRQKE